MHQNPAVELAKADVSVDVATDWQPALGRALIFVSSIAVVALIAVQLTKTLGLANFGFANWQPVALAVVVWSVCLCAGLILTRGQRGQELVFLLPAVVITFAFVIFPTIYALFIAFNSWNLSAANGRQFNGLDNFRRLFQDAGYWSAMGNMVVYVSAVLVQYVIAFSLALLLNQPIRGLKFFRVVFL